MQAMGILRSSSVRCLCARQETVWDELVRHTASMRFFATKTGVTPGPATSKDRAEDADPVSGQKSTPTASDLTRIPEDVYATLPDTVQRALLAEFAVGEHWQKLRELSARKAFQRHELDTGSSEVQIAVLTSRIANLTQHLRLHRKDVRTKRSLEYIVAQRRKLLRYLFRTEPERYEETVERLGIRPGTLVDQYMQRRARRPGDLKVPTGSRAQSLSNKPNVATSPSS